MSANRYATPMAPVGIRHEAEDKRHHVAIVCGEQHYLFTFDRQHINDALVAIGRLAMNPGNNFTWKEAAVVARRIRQLAKE